MFKFEDNLCYRMPVFFGGYPYQPVETCYHDVTTIAFAYITDGDRLAEYLPEGFELLRPELSVSFSQCREIDWLAGGAYNLIDVAVPVRFNGRRDQVEGNFSLVVWENRTAPILNGREETGVPKIFADIEDLHIMGDTRFTTASSSGNTFLQLAMAAPVPADAALAALFADARINALNWRYIPKVGAAGADISQPVLFPQRAEARSVLAGKGTVQWTGLRYEQCPSQAHIISALAELPMREMLPAIMTQGAVYLIPSRARGLE